MHRTIAAVTLLSLAACATGPEYVTRESGAFPPTVPVAQAEAECKAQAQAAVAGISDFGTIVGKSRAVYSSCLGGKGYEQVAAGS